MTPFYFEAIVFFLLVGFGIYILRRGQKSLHLQLNSRLTELIETTRKLAHAQGITIGRAEMKEEIKERKN